MKEPKEKTAEQALLKLTERCAKAEICLSDARRLMFRWRVPDSGQQEVIERLLEGRFIDEERYAHAFVRDKLNFSRWGTRKISEALYRKQIPSEIIKQAMKQAEEVSMSDRLESDLKRKNNSLREENPYKRKEKLLRFGISRGYDFETVMEAIERICDEPGDF